MLTNWAQKGAAWIKEMERLATEIETEVGPAVRYLGLDLPGDPGWSYGDDGPVLSDGPKLTLAWEPGGDWLYDARLDFLNLYIKYGRGMKGGHFNAGLTINPSALKTPH